MEINKDNKAITPEKDSEIKNKGVGETLYPFYFPDHKKTVFAKNLEYAIQEIKCYNKEKSQNLLDNEKSPTE
jgi:hypothetical protein